MSDYNSITDPRILTKKLISQLKAVNAILCKEDKIMEQRDFKSLEPLVDERLELVQDIDLLLDQIGFANRHGLEIDQDSMESQNLNSALEEFSNLSKKTEFMTLTNLEAIDYLMTAYRNNRDSIAQLNAVYNKEGKVIPDSKFQSGRFTTTGNEV